MTPPPSAAPGLRVLTGQRSAQGPRAANQDAVLCVRLADGVWLAAVADGMGGLHAGERASGTALRTFHRALAGGADLRAAVRAANEAVVEQAGDEASGTTLVAVLIRGNRMMVANVGDSRAWHLSPLGLAQLTRDHTLAAEGGGPETGGQAGRDAVAGSRWGSTLTRSLGGSARVDPDLFGPLPVEASGTLALTSDGVHGVLDAAEIARILEAAEDGQDAADALVEAALERGTGDNASAVVLTWTGGPTTSSHRPRVRQRSWDPTRLAGLSTRSRRRRRRIGVLFGVTVAAVVVVAGLYVTLVL